MDKLTFSSQEKILTARKMSRISCGKLVKYSIAEIDMGFMLFNSQYHNLKKNHEI
jgi:hypothetical protein